MAQVFRDCIMLLFGKECGKKVLDSFLDGFEADCMTLFLSRALSYGILLGGLFVKVPQIIRILNQGTAFGIPIFALILEIISLSLSVAYNFRKMHPFELYGEGFFLLIQTILIAFLVFFLGTEEKPKNLKDLQTEKSTAINNSQADTQDSLDEKDKTTPTSTQDGSVVAKKKGITSWPFLMASLFVCLLAFLYQFLLNFTTIQELALLVKYWAVPLFILSRFNQIIASFTAKSTGALSPISCFLVAAGSLARVFTTFVGVNDPLLMFSTSLAAFLNTVILVQIGLYAL